MIGELMIAIATACGFGAGYLAARHACPHPWTLELTPTRVRLVCPLCGVETPGWDLRLDRLSDRRRPVVDITDVRRVH